MDDGSSSPVRRFPLVSGGTAPDIALAQLIRRLAVARSLDEIMETVAAPARNLLDAGGVTFVLREAGDLCFYAEEDAISPLWKGKRFPMDACISGWCMREAKSVAIADIYQDDRIPHDVYRPTFVRSLAMVPVPQDRPIAAMGAYWAEAGEPSREAIDLLQAIGNAAALAISRLNAREETAELSARLSEFAHRVRNLFAMMQALTNRAHGETVAEFRRALSERIAALASVYAQIDEPEGGTVDLGALVDSILSSFASADGSRLDLAGPPVSLPASMATRFGLILCELSTNAVKHGALSADTGRVRVRWERDGGDLRLYWKELDGPPVLRPARTGFGTDVLQGTAAHSLNGDLQLHYEPDGLSCELRAPLGP